MKQLIYILFIGIMLVGCSKEKEPQRYEYQLRGSFDEVPLRYFWDGKGDPIINGTVKGEFSVELTTSDKIEGVLHLGYLNTGVIYEKDIKTVNFTLEANQTYTYSSQFSFYGEIYDEAFILIDITTTAPGCPAKIVNSKVRIISKTL